MPVKKKNPAAEKAPAQPAKRLKIGVIAVAALAVFFLLATSTLNNWIKTPAILTLLVGTGMLLQKFGNLEGYYGLLILRGTRGFGAMDYFATHFGKTAKRLADFGLSLGFGALYSYWLFGRTDKKKFLAHMVAMGVFFWVANYGITQQVGLWSWVIFALNMSFGLLAFGVQGLVMQGVKILTTADAAPGATLVIPGVTVPWEGVIAIIIAAAVHEIAHGILCKVEKLEVKNSGAILLGILPIGAFVEPNEEKMKDLELHKKRRILVAGTTSNFFVFLIFTFLTQLVAMAVVAQTDHVKIASISKEGSAFGILHENDMIYAVNGMAVKSSAELVQEVKKLAPGTLVTLRTSAGEQQVRLAAGQKLGVYLQDAPAPENAFAYGIWMFVFVVFNLTALINFALAVINLLPVFLTDGYRMVFEEARAAFPSKNDTTAKRISIAAGLISVALILVNFIPNFH